jgi:hypothetical protein
MGHNLFIRSIRRQECQNVHCAASAMRRRRTEHFIWPPWVQLQSNTSTGDWFRTSLIRKYTLASLFCLFFWSFATESTLRRAPAMIFAAGSFPATATMPSLCVQESHEGSTAAESSRRCGSACLSGEPAGQTAVTVSAGLTPTVSGFFLRESSPIGEADLRYPAEAGELSASKQHKICS